MAYQLGVDVGTTYTAAAVARDGRAEAFTLGTRRAAVPSVVYLDGDTLVVGDPAVRRAAVEPHRVAREFKRRLGDSTPLLLGGTPIGAERLMARLVAWVVEQVTATEGEPPASLRVTHPANWGTYKLDLLQQALRHVGLRVDHFVPEPVAAATFYAAQRDLPSGAAVAVYDLGGGTFDAAVVRAEVPGFRIVGRPDGIERLGGIDFDHAVFGHVVEAVGLDLDRLDSEEAGLRSALFQLRAECVEAKEALSAETDVTIPVFLPHRHHEVRLTRAELETMIRPALDETLAALRRAVDSAEVALDEVHAVLLVGGSSRIPLVAEVVTAGLGRPVAVDARPKDAISMGAALTAPAPVPAAGPSLAPPAGLPGPATPSPAGPPPPAAGSPSPATPATPVPAGPGGPPGLPPGGPATPPGMEPIRADGRSKAPRVVFGALGAAALLVILLLALSDGGSETPPDPNPGGDGGGGESITLASAWEAELDADALGVAVSGDTVVTLDLAGNVVAFDRDDGTERWRAALGGDASLASNGPELVDGLAVVQVSQSFEESIVAAFDVATGEERWRHTAGVAAAQDTMSARDGRVAVAAEPGTYPAPGRVLDAADGATVVDLGPNDGAGEPEPLGPPMLTDSHVVLVRELPGGEQAQQITAYSLEDGSVAWEQDFEPGYTTSVHGVVLVAELVREDDAATAESTELHALDPATGEEEWTAEIDDEMWEPPTAVGDLVLVRSLSNLFAIDPSNGEVVWDAGSSAGSAVAAIDDLVAVAGTELQVRDPADGSQLAATGLPSTDVKVMATAEDFAAVGGGRTLSAFTVAQAAAGSLEEAWRFEDDGLNGIGTATDELVVFGNSDNEAVAVDRETGEERWRSEVVRPAEENSASYYPAVAGDLVLLSAGDGDDIEGHEVVALSLDDGEERWRISVDRAPDRLEAERIGDVVVIAANPLQGVDAETGRVLWRDDGDLAISGADLTSDGTTVLLTRETVTDEASSQTGWQLVAVDGATGDVGWETTLTQELYDPGTVGAPESVVVAGDAVFAATSVGGLSIDGLSAFALDDGAPLWDVDAGGADTFAAGEQVVVFNDGQEVVGLDPSSGEERWRTPGQDTSAVLGVGDDVVAAASVHLLLVDAASGEPIDEIDAGQLAGFGRAPLVTDDLVLVQSDDFTTATAYRYR